MTTRGLFVITAFLLGSFAMADDQGDAVTEATIRQQIFEHLDDTDRLQQTVVCLGTRNGKETTEDLSKGLMDRLDNRPIVRRRSECEAKPDGAVEKSTGRPAIIITMGPVERRAQDEMWVEVAYFRSARLSALRTYRVVREKDGWVCLGQIVIDTPA